MKASEFDKKFDAGEDVSDTIDWSQARRRNDQPNTTVAYSVGF